MKSSETNYRSSRRWTVIIVRRFGDITNHEISGFWVKAAAVLLLLVVVGSVYLLIENRDLTAERQRPGNWPLQR